MKYYFVTGEPSGDIHAANLVSELKILDPNNEIRAWGGERLIAEGVSLVKNIKDTAFMGIWSVVKNLKRIKENLDFCKKDILDFNPDALILVDYPAFNLRIAKFAKGKGIKVYYYISPKVWAWNASRIDKIKKFVDHLLVIFPFEVDFFKKHKLEVTYVGNPILDEISKKNCNLSIDIDKPIVALLPGSRRQEVEKILPLMLSVISDFTKYKFVIAATNSLSKEYYNYIIQDKNVSIVYDETYALLKNAKYALVTSGTASLETALFKVPQVVCYKTNYLTYFIARKLIKIKYLSLVNILLNKSVVNELIQSELHPNNIKLALRDIMRHQNSIIIEYEKIIKLLDKKGASKNTAKFILKTI